MSCRSGGTVGIAFASPGYRTKKPGSLDSTCVTRDWLWERLNLGALCEALGDWLGQLPKSLESASWASWKYEMHRTTSHRTRC